MTRAGQMRRYSRRLSRSGFQPMMMVTSDDRLPETAAVLIFRWAWRYRSELGPLVIAAATMAVGAIAHVVHHAGWPAIVAAIAAIAAGLLAGFGRRLGLTSLAERSYAATVVTTMGGWLSAAIAAGPLRGPLPQILAIGCLVLAIPWWTSHRRRARVRVERKLEAWPVIAESVGLARSRVMSAVVTAWGWQARFGLARGQTIADVITKLPAIESGLGTTRGAARAFPTPDNRAHRFELRVLEIDPHADAIPWPGPSISAIAQPIDLGPFEDAEPCRVLLLRLHALLGGMSGSGKSGGVNVLMGNLTACRDVVIWAIDLKRGMELQPWASCIGRLATTPAQALMLLRDAVTVLEARADYLTSHGQRVWRPTQELPALVIVIDEYAELAADTASYTDSIARRGRAPAVTLIAATQRPTQKAMGQGAVRSQMDVRICFRVRERKDTDLILGQGMLTAGWHPHQLNAPGKFLISAPGHDTPRRARAYLLDDELVAATAARHAAIRPALDQMSATAIGTPIQDQPTTSAQQAIPSPTPQSEHSDDDSPDALLWDALSLAGNNGIPVTGLMAATGMSRRWVYYRLRDLANAGRAVASEDGTWRAADCDSDAE